MTRARDLSLYTLQSIDGGFLITKFDSIGLEILSQYEMMGEHPSLTCPCPQGLKPSCRHRKMFPMMIGRVDKPWFFCYDTGEWKAMTKAEGPYGMESDDVPGPGDDNGAAKPYEEKLAALSKLVGFDVTDDDARPETVSSPSIPSPSPAPKPMRRI